MSVPTCVPQAHSPPQPPGKRGKKTEAHESCGGRAKLQVVLTELESHSLGASSQLWKIRKFWPCEPIYQLESTLKALQENIMSTEVRSECPPLTLKDPREVAYWSHLTDEDTELQKETNALPKCSIAIGSKNQHRVPFNSYFLDISHVPDLG